MIAIPQDAIDLVKHFEGLSLNAYRDPAGIPTIGYGHTGHDVAMGQSITPDDAEALLASDLEAAAHDVAGMLRIPPTSGQLGALTSFAFNLGAGALESSTLLRMINTGDAAGAANQFGRWTHVTVNGMHIVLPGLVTRRAAEAAMFSGKDWRSVVSGA